MNNPLNNHTHLPDDDDVPFSKPDDIRSSRSDTHPQTDSNVDSDEAYHEGLDTATNSNPERA